VIANLRVLKFQVVLKLIGAHEAHDRNAALHKDEKYSPLSRTRLTTAPRLIRLRLLVFDRPWQFLISLGLIDLN
jgi:hypothetical protein